MSQITLERTKELELLIVQQQAEASAATSEFQLAEVLEYVRFVKSALEKEAPVVKTNEEKLKEHVTVSELVETLQMLSGWGFKSAQRKIYTLHNIDIKVDGGWT